MEIARWMIALVAFSNFGGIFVDAWLPPTARTHLYNPAWRPHAKFHNCQTMLLGIVLGCLALVLLFAVKPLTFPLLVLAAVVGGLYVVAMLVIVPLFPGTAWVDPEFGLLAWWPGNARGLCAEAYWRPKWPKQATRPLSLDAT